MIEEQYGYIAIRLKTFETGVSATIGGRTQWGGAPFDHSGRGHRGHDDGDGRRGGTLRALPRRAIPF